MKYHDTGSPLRSFITSLYAFALSLGGPGLFTIAALDSSFVSLPQINDLLVVLMVTENKAWMPYYALMATLGSVVGCSILYVLANKGGEALLRRRRLERTRRPGARALPPPRRAGADGPGAPAAAGAVQAVRARCRDRRRATQ